MQMIDVIKRLAELDAKNPNIVKESTQVAECGIMPEMGLGGMSQPHSPASINMTAASGPELSGMLRDIMQLAGMNHSEPAGAEADGDLGGEPQPQTLEPAGGGDATTTMRSVIDKLNIPGDDQEGDEEGGDDQEGGDLGPFQGNQDDDQQDDQEDDQEETDEAEYDNSPEPETTGYGSMTPSGDDMHREKKQNPGAAAKGDNPMTMEQRLLSDYKKFMNEN